MATLFPGYFALVMASGIVAIAAQQQRVEWLAALLYIATACAYAVLVVLVVWRLIRFTDRIVADATSHAKGFAFLTIVAATNVLGSASAVIHDWWDAAQTLWWIGSVLWVAIVYIALIAVVLRNPKPGMGDGINGTWFLLTVSTESVAVLGALLVGHGDGGDLLAFTAVAAFALGLVLYMIVMTMVFLRWTFQPLEPNEADPPAWIASGAVAITVLAGSNLLAARSVSSRLERLATTIETLVVLAWATATFWFPVMIAIGIWRHLVRRTPLRYHPSYWALVFPIGMYSASTFRMTGVIGLHGLRWITRLTFAIALAAWTAATLGLMTQAVRAVGRRRDT